MSSMARYAQRRRQRRRQREKVRAQACPRCREPTMHKYLGNSRYMCGICGAIFIKRREQV